MNSTIEEVRSGVDWLTATLPAENGTADLWVERALGVLDRIAEQGYEHYTRSLQGYIGVSAGNCFVGTRTDGHLVQLSGHHANDHYATVFRPDLHVSRLDVQMTVKYHHMPSSIAQGAFADATLNNLTLPVPRRRKLVYIHGSDGGDTTYIGAPSSEQRGRVYNKEVQSEDISYRRTWRWEVVLRNELSSQSARDCPTEVDPRSKWARSLVVQWFKARGVDCGVYWSDMSATLPIARTLPSDVAKKLAWLEKQVAPTVRWLQERGYDDTIRSVLGLSHPYSPD